MEIRFADTFFDSLRKLRRRERWFNRTWGFLVDFTIFFKNIWLFKKALWEHRWWDWRFMMVMMATSLKIMEKGMHDGYEIEKTRDKKIAKMQRAIHIIETFSDDKFIELAEKELGDIVLSDWEFEDSGDGLSKLIDDEPEDVKAHNRAVYERADEIETLMWEELWQIFKGQDTKTFTKNDDLDPDKSYDHWNDQFDGSGMRGWWD